MRLPSILLLVAAAFVVNCDATSAGTTASITSYTNHAESVKSSRFLRSIKSEEENDDEDSEERMTPSALVPLDDLLTKLKINEQVLRANLKKADLDILNKIEANPPLQNHHEVEKAGT
uniref:RxLR effector protein n=1 Tax=Phytophthora agathidicida TaxID=1642459 RepID=A0A7G4WI17_9STRA|nr:PaRXLR28 [Phytophthora agathidicida]